MTAPTRVPCSYPECGGGCAGCQPEPQQTPRPSWVDGGAGLHSRKCATCGGSGWIGGPSYYSPDEGGKACPTCEAEYEAFKACLGSMPEWMPEFEVHRAWVEQFAWNVWQHRASLPAPNQGEAS